MHTALIALITFMVGWVGGATFRAKIQADAIARANSFYKELVIRGDAAIGVLSKVKEGLAQVQGDGRKRVVLAEDLTNIRRVAGFPEASQVQPDRKIKIVG